MILQSFLEKLVSHQNLSIVEARELFKQLTSESTTSVYSAAILAALTTKGETVGEITGFIQAMREQMVTIKAPKGTIDVCGTGGDGKGLFNISTAVAIVTASCGVPVAKHGNRAASSTTGSADVLEELGVGISLTKEQAEEVLQKVGLVFLFAPLFHPSMKAVGQVRKELKIRTVFNMLGPFANPAGVTRQVIGVPTEEIAQKLFKVAKELPYTSVALVTSDDGLDEISIAAPSHIFLKKEGKSQKMIINPQEYGYNYANVDALKIDDAKESAKVIKEVLQGKSGPARDIVVLNTALALVIADKCRTLEEGITMATSVLETGKAQK